MEDNAVFVGWYRNPECTGERFDLSAHVMPANHLALYAKWVNGLFTVETYLEDKTTLYTYEGYSGIQTDIEKYSLAEEPTAPSKEGKSFVGWFYEEEGVEKPFSFTMPITKDYKLYAKFTDQVLVSYTVHYYRLNTTEKVADDVTRTAMIGSNVTEKAKWVPSSIWFRQVNSSDIIRISPVQALFSPNRAKRLYFIILSRQAYSIPFITGIRWGIIYSTRW